MFIRHLKVQNKAMLVVVLYKCIQILFCAPWPGTTDSHRVATEARLQEKDDEIERLQQELKLQRVHS